MSEPTDPPVEPMAGTDVWFETGPEPLRDDPELAVLMVQVGLATNALTAQHLAGKAAQQRLPAAEHRDVAASMVTTAALLFEAIRLARENMQRLRELAEPKLKAKQKLELLQRVGRLCAGKHPASPLLDRARNQLAFHWDADVIAPMVMDYAKNERVVWVERMNDDESGTVHRMAVDVLLLSFVGKAESTHEEISQTLSHVGDATKLIVEFFTAATFGYFERCKAATRNAERSTERRQP